MLKTFSNYTKCRNKSLTLQQHDCTDIKYQSSFTQLEKHTASAHWQQSTQCSRTMRLVCACQRCILKVSAVRLTLPYSCRGCNLSTFPLFLCDVCCLPLYFVT